MRTNQTSKGPLTTDPTDRRVLPDGSPGGQFIRDCDGIIVAEVFPCVGKPGLMEADAALMVSAEELCNALFDLYLRVSPETLAAARLALLKAKGGKF